MIDGQVSHYSRNQTALVLVLLHVSCLFWYNVEEPYFGSYRILAVSDSIQPDQPIPQ